MIRRLVQHLIGTPATSVQFTTGVGMRIVVDFTGTRRAEPDAVVLRDATMQSFAELIALARPGTAIEVVGLHLVPQRPDDLGRHLASILSPSRGLTVFIDPTGASARWRRRMVGNLCRFGCIPRCEAISHIDAHNERDRHHASARHRE